MRTLFLAATLAALLVSCNTAVNLPDPTTTGFLVVAYQPEAVGVSLTPGSCDEVLDADPIATAELDVAARAYYNLTPGGYCLAWGPRTGPTSFTVAGMRPVEVQAGALELVTLVGPEPELVPG